MIRTLPEGTTDTVCVKIRIETGQQKFLTKKVTFRKYYFIQTCLFRLILTKLSQENMKNNFNLEVLFPIWKIMLICRIT